MRSVVAMFVFAYAHMMTKLTSVIAGFIKRCNKPVLVADSFCGSRYILPEQESRIRVSGTTTSLSTTGLRLRTGRFCLQRLTPHFLSALLLPVSASSSRLGLVKNCVCDITSRSVRLYSSVTMPEKHFERLPKSVVPKSYDLFLKPNLSSFTFEGREKIKITVSY